MSDQQAQPVPVLAPHPSGLFLDFGSAARLVRQARPKLRLDLIDNAVTVVDEYYSLLNRVEAHVAAAATAASVTAVNSSGPQTKNKKNTTTTTNKHKLFVVEVEGLDGSGKTTLVSRLAKGFGEGTVLATKTPSPQLKAIRPLWDYLGGMTARAFYTLGNYLLEYEIAGCQREVDNDDDSSARSIQVVIVDRWYASTCAYTLAYTEDGSTPTWLDWKRHSSSATSSAASKSSNDDDNALLLAWPQDLSLRPDLLLVLEIDLDVRQERVNQRRSGGSTDSNSDDESRFNPWDDRLAADPELAQRIQHVFEQIQGPVCKHTLNANAAANAMLEEALQVIEATRASHRKVIP